MKKAAAIIITVLLLAVASPVQAEIIRIAIEATVDWVDDQGDYLEGNITPGDIITGTYTYDSDTADSNPSSTVGDYWHYNSPFGISLNVGGFDFKTDPTDVEILIEVINNSTSGELHDGYGVLSYNNSPLSNGVPVDMVSWWLRDNTANALLSDALLITAPVLDNWEQPWGLRLESDRRFMVNADVTSAFVVPEPASIIAFGYAFIVLRKYGAKKQRRKQ